MEVQRAAYVGGDSTDAVEQHPAGVLDDLRVALDLLDGGLETNVHEPAVRVLQRELAALGEVGGQRVDATARRAGEGAAGAAGDREIGQAADVQVEHLLAVRPAAVQRADHREGGEVDALGLEAGRPQSGQDALDHLAACRDEQDAQAPAGLVFDDVELVVVEDGVVERHRKLVLRLEAHRRVDLLVVLQVREVDHADDDLLVGESDADPLVEALVRAVQGAQRFGQAIDVGDFAVADDPRLERREGGVLDTQAAVDRNGGGHDAGGVDVEADEVLGALGH
jgi:hypothetical protein